METLNSKKILVDDKIRASIPDNEYKYLKLLEFYEDFQKAINEFRDEIGKPRIHPTNGLIGWEEKAPNVKLLHEKVGQLITKLKIEPLFYGAIMDIIQYGIVVNKLQPVQVFQAGGLSKAINPHIPVVIIQKKLSQKQFIESIKNNWTNIEAAMNEHEKQSGYLLALERLPVNEIENNSIIYWERKKKVALSKIYNDNFQKGEKEDSGYSNQNEMSRKYKRFIKGLKKLGFISS